MTNGVSGPAHPYGGRATTTGCELTGREFVFVIHKEAGLRCRSPKCRLVDLGGHAVMAVREPCAQQGHRLTLSAFRQRR